MPEQQLVEIARALGAEARVLIMDEPTASLAETEAERLLALVRELRAQGVGIVYISHRLPRCCALADRVTVLRDGAVVETRAGGRARPSAELIRMMVGRELDAVFPKRRGRRSATWCSRRAACRCRAGGVRDVRASTSARARSSAWPASSAPGAPSWRACSSA